MTAPVVTADIRPNPPRNPRWARLWWWFRALACIALAYIAVQIVVANSAELAGASGYLEQATPLWIVVAVGAEALSYLNFTLLQRRLLGAGGLRIRLVPLAAISLAGNAITNSLPGGGAFATVFAYRQFRRRGADEALTTWTLVAFTALTAITLAAISVVGLVIAGSDGPVGGLAPLIGLLVVGPAIGVAILLRPRLLVPLVVPVLRLSRRTVRFPRHDPGAVVGRLVVRLEAVKPRARDWLFGLAFAGGNWVADCTCLVFAFAAVHAGIPWRGLLVAYAAAQVVANLPVTPGGLGVVEGSLTVALVAFGGSTAQTVAGVLLYRIISFWVVVPVGWCAWLGLEVAARRAVAPAAGLVVEP